MRILAVVAALCLVTVGCSDPAQFRPAKDAKDYPSSKDAYRVKEQPVGCDELGFVVQAAQVEDIATTASRHGGTHYMVLDDFSDTTVETDGIATRGAFGVVYGHSTSREEKHHAFTARVYRCMFR